MKVCLGGTFDIFHNGHKALINKAFEKAGKNGLVFIGITKGDAIKDKKIIRNFNDRKQTIEKYISNKNFVSSFEIKPIQDKYGPSIDRDFDAIVVSPETKKTAIEINKIRKEKNKLPLKIVEIPYVLADDNKPISSTRIRNKKIDEEGNIL